jgi:deoxyribonuclease-4
MPILGAHQSIAGGYYKAVERARATGCDCVQVFTKNNNQWRAKPISPEEAQQFKDALKKLKVKHPLAHDSYLINLASPDAELWKKSIDSFVVELQRAEMLGIPYVVTHPGSYTTSTEGRGIKRVAKALDEVHRQTKGLAAKTLLENTAGQGSALGWKLEHLTAIRDAVRQPERIGGVCLDTCHLFAAGYALAEEKDYRATIRAIDQTVGLRSVKAFHLNDSKTRCGSRVDRHAHIGRGEIGIEAFRRLVNDRRWARTPMYIETNKGEENGVDLDVINLNMLRNLINTKKTQRS